MRRLVAAMATTSLLAACSGVNGPPPDVPTPGPKPPPAVVHVVCPGEPPPAGYACAPPFLCRYRDQIIAWDTGWVSQHLLSARFQQLAMDANRFVADYCATPAGTIPRARG